MIRREHETKRVQLNSIHIACSRKREHGTRQPWQRGQYENTNGLLRQYFLKGSDFRKLKAEDVQAAVMELNNRPRKKYQFKSPHELFEPKTRAFQN